MKVNKTGILAESVTMDDLGIDEEFINVTDFENATRGVVQTIGREFKTNVIFAGDSARTQKDVVTLPAQDPTKNMTKKQYVVAQGYANHETMHTLCTDLTLFEKELTICEKSEMFLTSALINSVEDVRIENAAAKLYDGMPMQLSSVADFAAKTFLEKHLVEDPEIVKDPKKIGPLAMTWVARRNMGYNSPYIKKCIDALSPEVLKKVEKWTALAETIETGVTDYTIDRSKSQDATKETIRIAKLIAKEIRNDADEEEEKPNEGDGSGDGDGEGEGSEGSTNSNRGSQANGQTKEAYGTVPVDMGKMVNDLLMDHSSRPNLRPVTTALDVTITRKTNGGNEILNRKRGEQDYLNMAADINGKVAMMKRKLERALLAKAEADYQSGTRQGKLDIRRRGVDIMRGRENVYKKKTDGEAIDTAVQILVDISGSMSCGNKMSLAARICMAMAQCFDKTGVALEVLCFNNGNLDSSYYPSREYVEAARASVASATRGSGKFHRSEPLRIWEIKAFDDSLKESRISFGNMQSMAGGNNSDGDAILTAANRLNARPEKKKLLVVLSDGSPAYGYIDGSASTYTKSCVDFVTNKLRIPTIGVGILDNSVSNYYKNYTVLHDLSDLDKAVMDKIAKMIIGEDFKVDNGDLHAIASNYKSLR